MSAEKILRQQHGRPSSCIKPYSPKNPSHQCIAHFYYKPYELTLFHTTPTLKKKALENIVGKGENAGNQHFLLLPPCFLPLSKQISVTFILSSANALNLDHS